MITSHCWRHAIVIGGSLSGLVTARVLSEHFEQVTIVERDVLTDDENFRSGVPQACHVHGLISRGADALNSLFPELQQELELAGAPVFDRGEQSSIWFPVGSPFPTITGIRVQAFTRNLLESRYAHSIQFTARV